MSSIRGRGFHRLIPPQKINVLRIGRSIVPQCKGRYRTYRLGACLSSKRALPLPLGLPVSAFCLGLLLRALIHQLGWTHGGFRADSGRVSGGFRRFPGVSGIVSDASRLKKTSKIHTCPLLSIDTYVLTDKNLP